MNKKLEYLKKVSKVQKQDFSKVENVNEGFNDLLQDLYKMNDLIDKHETALSELDNVITGAMGKFVDIAKDLEGVKEAADNLGIHVSELLHDDVNMFLDQFGEYLDNNNQIVARTFNDILDFDKI